MSEVNNKTRPHGYTAQQRTDLVGQLLGAVRKVYADEFGVNEWGQRPVGEMAGISLSYVNKWESEPDVWKRNGSGDYRSISDKVLRVVKVLRIDPSDKPASQRGVVEMLAMGLMPDGSEATPEKVDALAREIAQRNIPAIRADTVKRLVESANITPDMSKEKIAAALMAAANELMETDNGKAIVASTTQSLVTNARLLRNK